MNPELVIALVGIGGTIIGTALGSAGNILADRRRAKTDAIVWRRQHTLTAAAEFLSATSVIQVEGRTIKDFAEEIVTAHQGRHETGNFTSGSRPTRRRNMRLCSVPMTRSRDSASCCRRRRSGQPVPPPHRHPAAPSAMAVRAHLNDLLREDLGLPAREIAAGSEISPEEYLEKVAELRKPSATD
jgi:hypothetical protein